jgi:predicted DNA-binding transcriptional regulator AlpA
MSSALLSGTMNTAAAAEYVGISEATLKRYRKEGGGPEYIRLGARIIKYRQTDLDRWLIKAKVDG